MARPAAPIVLPRALIFLASVWLIGTWLLAIGVRPPIAPTASSYEPGVRLMIVCLAMGLMIGWPLLRLSQIAPAAPRRQTLLDLVVLLAMTQVVIWPMRLVTSWSAWRTAAIDATICGWTALAGAIVAAALTTNRRGARHLGMVACLGMCFIAPALALLPVQDAGDARALSLLLMSPLLTARALGMSGGPVTPEQWSWIALLGTAAILTWAALAATCARAARQT